MTDLSSLNDYIVDLDFFTRSFIEQRVRKFGVDSVLKVQFESLDCSKRTKDGNVIQQTNGYMYKYDLSQTIEIINIYGKDKDSLLEQLKTLHENNLKYEKDNPPPEVKHKRVKGERKVKESKETAAERKLKAQAAKIGRLSLKLKPTNGKENS